VEGVAVAVAGGAAHHADVAVVVEPAELDVVGDVAPDEIVADAVPGRPFSPEHAGVQPLDRRIADLVLLKAFVERDEVRIGIADGRLAGPGAVGGGCQRGSGRGRGGGGEEAAPGEHGESSFELRGWAAFYGNARAGRGWALRFLLP